VDQKLAWRWTREASSPGEVRKKARQWGITHIVFNFISAEYRGVRWYGGRPWDDRQLELYRTFLERYARPVWRSPTIDFLNGGFCAWRLERRPGAPGAWVPWYLPGTEGLFNESSAPWVVERRSVGVARYTGWYETIAARLPDVGYGLHQRAQAYDNVNRKDLSFPLYERLYRMRYPGGGAWHAYARALHLKGREAECVRAALDQERLFDRPETRDLVAAGLFETAARDFKAGRRARALSGLDASAGIATRSAEVCLALARGYTLAGEAPAARRFLDHAVEAGARGREVDAVIAGIVRLEGTGR
jgi:hypothetical protein